MEREQLQQLISKDYQLPLERAVATPFAAYESQNGRGGRTIFENMSFDEVLLSFNTFLCNLQSVESAKLPINTYNVVYEL